MTRKVYFYSLIRTQLRLSNLFADCSLDEAWGLPALSIIVGGEIEKPVRRNRPFPLVIRSQLPHKIARVVARWQRPKAGRLMAIGLNKYISWRLSSNTIGCIRAWLGRAKSEVDKSVYLVHWQYISGVRYWALNDKGLGWKIQSIWNYLQPESSDQNTRIA